MALRKIVKHGDPVLRRKCLAVKQIDKEILRLIDDMFETMYDAPGIGLAANQIGVPLRLAVIDIQENGKKSPIVLINPKVVELKGRLFEEEGCLSIPGFLAPVKRYAFAKVEALNEKGFPVTLTGEGLLSRAFQHETDHLIGKFFVDRASLLKRLRMYGAIRRYKKTHPW
ncbi:MAG: peptide deformylase [Elusimicrobia bacterium RIFCSPLOWO2_01_FULL_60_11]|nr:MAG: peptide deformylase [Elusimicrobia bacterium RIFCSPLOWO2_01_FULL_60_11]